MTLKRLCALYKIYEQNPDACASIRSQYMHDKRGLEPEELSLDDLDELRPFLLCDTLSIYEYLGGSSDLLRHFMNVSCPKEENDIYNALLRNPFNPNASELFDKLLQTSIEPFKSRGILCGEFNSAV
jgi:hypothetical protein